ncbi:Cytochrome c, class I [hydrothermal vent metagenome]|uniref:Cytochrome c, class I n=1 Tax=hydrothermal vent metagenome TaxID=652676 RepID=A0A1W1CGI5_9ZZZZ
MSKNILLFSTIIYFLSPLVFATEGKKVFETYCWGCHHQTAVAFGPPFEEIASKRSANEIKAMITDPKSVSKVFGYKRNAMPAFQLSDENLSAITNYILRYKQESNISIEHNISDINKTIIEKPYPSIAINKKVK